MYRVLSAFTFVVLLLPFQTRAQEPSKPLRVGIIGLDTSHVVAFTNILHKADNKGDLAGIKVVAGYPAGSPDLAVSRDRIADFTKTLKEKHNVEIVDSIEALLPKVDAVLLESVDGRPHLAQVKPVLKAKKPVFIDKPVAASLADAIQIYELAREHKVPVFSSSSLRYYPSIVAVRDDPKLGDVLGCVTYGSAPIGEHHPDLFWYGIHGVEALYAIMGPGCESVARMYTPDADMVTGTWKGGRLGTFRGIRKGASGYGALVFGSKAIVPATGSGSYQPLLVEICKFFRTGKPPVSAEETLELIAFMEAADESKRLGGQPVKLENIFARAREQIAKQKAK